MHWYRMAATRTCPRGSVPSCSSYRLLGKGALHTQREGISGRWNTRERVQTERGPHQMAVHTRDVKFRLWIGVTNLEGKHI